MVGRLCRRLLYLGDQRDGFVIGGTKGSGDTDEFEEGYLQRTQSALPRKQEDWDEIAT